MRATHRASSPTVVAARAVQSDPLLDEVRRSPPDAIIVGAGDTGGRTAKELAEVGVPRGGSGCRTTDDARSGRRARPPDEIKYLDNSPNEIASPEVVRSRPMQSKQGAWQEVDFRWFAKDVENPFTTLSGKPFVRLGRGRANLGPPELPPQQSGLQGCEL